MPSRCPLADRTTRGQTCHMTIVMLVTRPERQISDDWDCCPQGALDEFHLPEKEYEHNLPWFD